MGLADTRTVYKPYAFDFDIFSKLFIFPKG